ncbi:MAG TPA: T9SS type A sorting domain-containing protein, partial [Bacteroidia bacterium]
MKQKLPAFLIAFLAYTMIYACPVIRLGKLTVVDENGNWIKGAEIIKYYDGGQDSIVNTVDSTGYWIRSEGLNWDSDEAPRPVEFKYRIRAKGYADWKIKDISITRGNYKDMPTLEVHMYHHRYMMMGNVLTKMMEFTSNTVSINYVKFFALTLENSVESVQLSSYTESSELQASFKINTFPNPVKDQLNIVVKDSIVLPYKAVICDLSGRIIVEQELTQNLTDLNLQFEAAGFYLVSVYK